MNRIKLYMSLPITGYDLKERKKDAIRYGNIISNMLKNMINREVELVTPFDVCQDLTRPYEELIGLDVTALMRCDYMIMLDGWKESKGCRIEYEVAKVMGIRTLEFTHKKKEDKDLI